MQGNYLELKDLEMRSNHGTCGGVVEKLSRERKQLNRRMFFQGRLDACARSERAYFLGGDPYADSAGYYARVSAHLKCALERIRWRPRIKREAAGLR